MKKVFFTLFVTFVFSQALNAQVDYRVLSYNGPGNGIDQSRALCVDPVGGSVFITGNSFGGSSTDMDYCTLKCPWTDFPHPVWNSRFNGTGTYTDQANVIALDNSSNVYVSGWAHMESSLDCGTIDYVTVKYNNAGVQQWVMRYNGPGNTDDMVNAIAVDNSGNVYITGSSVGSNTSEDIATIKYNTAGVQQWVARYNGPSNGSDVGRAIGVDASGNVYVTGSSFQTGGGSDYITIKYNSSGVQQWAARYNGPGNGDDTAFAMKISRAGNVIVTGCSKGTTTNLDYTTISYGSDGSLIWVKTYNGPGNGIDEAKSMALDLSDNIYITGYSLTTGTNYDFATIAYDPFGNVKWIQRYNGPANLDDKACGIAISRKACGGFGDDLCWAYSIYVTGQSKNVSNKYDYLTIKYDINGDTVWTKRFSAPLNGNAIPSAIAAPNNSDYVFVTGTADDNYLAIEYFTTPFTSPFEAINKNKSQLLQNYPNPFNPTTKIKYYILSEANVNLKIYDITGKDIAVLVDGRLMPGNYETSWDASNIPSGVYFYTLEANGIKLDTKRMLLVK